MSLVIRNAKIEDAVVISNIHALSWKTAYKGMVPQQYLDELRLDFWVPAFQKWIGEGLMEVLIGYEDEIAVGCIAYGRARDEKMPDWGEIVSIYLLPSHFNKGYGKKLLNAAITNMQEAGYSDCYLWVLRENERARKFYEKNGFVCSDEEYKCEIMGKELIDIKYTYHIF